MPRPTTTIFWRWAKVEGLGLPSTGSPRRSLSSTGIAGIEQYEIMGCLSDDNYGLQKDGNHSSFEKISIQYATKFDNYTMSV
jgi:hypothetical protein